MSSAESLREFVRELIREVCVRTGDFTPRNELEQTWKAAGPCDPRELDTFKAEATA
jgi:hypothetical protein